MIPPAAIEKVIDASGAAPRIEAMLPAGVRARQLSIRTLLAGMCLAQAGGRPARLTRVRQALVSLPGDDQRRLGVLADRRRGPHLLTCRQAEYTFGLAVGAPGTDKPDGLPPGSLQRVCDDLPEASVPAGFKDASASLAVDWTDLESFSRPPPHGTRDCAGLLPGCQSLNWRDLAEAPPQHLSQNRYAARSMEDAHQGRNHPETFILLNLQAMLPCRRYLTWRPR